MLALFPGLALSLALIAIGRGALGGQFLEAERRRDRIARYVCFSMGVLILLASVCWAFL